MSSTQPQLRPSRSYASGAIEYDSEVVPASLSNIPAILRVANEVEQESPRVAYLCRFYAFEKAHREDPSSSQRGVRQFKTALFNRLEKDDEPTKKKRQERTDPREIQHFYQQYYDKYVRALDGQSADRQALARAYQTAGILFEVLSSVVKTEELDPNTKVIDSKVREKKETFISYNILPLDTAGASQAIMQLPEVKAALEAIRNVRSLPWPANVDAARIKADDLDILEWLQAMFGFQKASVANQREHLIMLLANVHVRLTPKPEPLNKLDPRATEQVMNKLFKNYKTWCKFLGRKTKLELPEIFIEVQQRRILYMALHLLIWGEAANLRFMPECLCYIYHHMASEVAGILSGRVSYVTGEHVKPAYAGGEETFLKRIVTPIYEVLDKEKDLNKNGKPHSAWRNYDDLNEYFWSEDCFRLSWPMRADDEFFIKPTASHEQPPSKVSKGLLRFDFLNQRGPRRLKKTGFVEVRSFWHIFRSFDRMWTFYILSLQAMIIVAWNGTGSVVAVFDGAVIKKVLSVFITAAGLRFLQALLDIIMNLNALHSLRFTGMLRLFLKLLVSIFWIIILSTSYAHSWENPTSLGKAFDWGNSSAPVYLVAVILYLVPNGIAALFFIFPMLRRVSEESDSMPARFLLWWSQPRLYVGRGMHEGLVDLFKYTFFWIGLLACKLSFSYFVEIKPLVAPTKVILNATDIRYEWHEFFPTGTHNIGALLAVWAPVILVYFMDTQIWYALVSTIWGGFVGAFMRLGEVRTLKMLRARFQALPGTFNAFLVHDDRAHRHHFYISKRLAPYPGEDRMKEAKFAQLWNEIIGSFREEDLINDWEMELMLVPYSADRFMQMDMIQWPSFLLATKTPMAIRMTRDFAMKESSPKDDVLWRKISADPFMVCAVKESYLHLKFVLAEIIEGEEEKRIIDELIDEVEEHKANGTLLDNFRMSELSYLHELFVDLVHYLVKGDPSDRENFIILLQDMLELVLKDMMDSRLSDESTQSLDDARRPQLFTSMEPKPAVRFPPTFSDDASRDIWNEQIRRLSLLLTVEEDAMKIPMNLEARRRLAFFTNSLFMDMPHAPLVHHMIPFSVLTPYYDEEVVYGKKALEMANEDGVSIIFYLQNVYPDEWKHFLERVKPKDAKEIEELDLRAWASYRGQTLSRTVRGMMYYRKALELQAFLDMASDEDVLKGYKVISKNRDTEQKQQGSFWAKLDAIVDMKFTYVATCQMYGAQKRSTDPASHQRAVDILQLMKRYPSLRVAYIDEVEEHDKKVYYSVLVKAVEGFDQEIYRIRLPGSVKIGEGKPENQNHAIIFTRGEGLQTIDMNQDNYLEETLKMRNLLEEFNDRHHGVRLPTILGVRENIFTGSVSSLAWFMSNQETSFVTIGQRILADPLKVRFHYGHPDVFDRLFHITRGGVSKASKVINLSEDIFAGFNSTLRRGNVTHHEYIQVGKGRDVGLNQISMFEAKVANGNGEQTLSRDIYRLGHRFDFFRMMSCYFTTVGFYYNTMIVVLTVYVFLYGRLYLALSGLERSLTNQGHKDNDLSLKAALASQSLVQLGLLMALPMIMEIGLERGFLAALSDFVVMQLQLASVFFTFSLGTKVHYYARTIFHGGAKYRATGREFVVRHVKFAENYRLYSRSHFTKGFEIMMLLIVYNVYGVSPQDAVAYIFITFSMWFLVGTWLFSPFLFNPSGFEWQKIVEDWTDWNKWIYSKGRIGVPPEKSWESWWDEEQEHLQYTGFRGCVIEIILALRFLIYQYGLVYHLDITREHKNISIYGLSWVVILSVFGILKLIAFGRKQFKADFQLIFRMLKGVIFISLLAVIGVMFRFVNLTVQDLFVSVLAFLPTGWGLLLIAQACRPLVGSGVWDSVQALARTYEFIMGLFLFAPVAILAWFPFVSEFQTRLLFNQAFSRGLQISRILAGNKRQRVTD